MQSRWLLSLCLVPIIALLVIFPGGSVVTRSYMAEAALQSGTALRLAVSALNGHLNRYEPLPALIADHEGIRGLLDRPEDDGLRARVNAYLKTINTLLESSDIYVMTLDGNTIAASNFDRPTSFVDQNFSYRPYFQEAARGQHARFFALGTTSLKRGYYFSSPVTIDGSIRGVIVFKVDIDSIEATWRGGEYRIFVTDPQGIIFMTGNADWLYSSTLPLTRERLALTEASRRYADAALRELPLVRSRFDTLDLVTIETENGSREYLQLVQDMPEAGWTVNVLTDTSSVRAQARTMVIAALLVLCLAGLALTIILQRRARLTERMTTQANAHSELERRVAERTADLARVNARIEEEIAERRQTELQLRQTQADLIQAGKLAGLGQMSAALSHEMNQPLAAARTYADSAAVLIERGRFDDARDNISRIAALIDRMASISRHLRNFARKPNEKLGPVDLADAMRDTVEIVAARLSAADATLEIDLGDPAPLVRAGPVRLQQVLVNIISNAADSVEGLEDRRIHVCVQRLDDTVTLTVRDHGPGVPPSIAERIFDPFFTTKGVGKGLGLGLSISYNIIKDFGGSLTVANHPDGGAVFSVALDGADGLKVAAE